MIYTILILIVVVILFCIPLTRILILNLFQALIYFLIDVYGYYVHNKFNEIKTGELVAYVGLFGKGKTLSAVEKVYRLYKSKNNKKIWCRERKKFVTQKIKILSNVSLIGLPCENFITLQQIVDFSKMQKIIDFDNDTLTALLVLGDEFSVQMNSRNFKSNIDSLFLNTILTCRHHHISLYYTAQRFNHVDALLRQVTSYVVDCNKIWRIQLQSFYDAWDLENATTPTLLKAIKRTGFFVKNKHYNLYNTLAVVDNLSKAVQNNDMLSTSEILQIQQSTVQSNVDSIQNLSRKYKKTRQQLNK